MNEYSDDVLEARKVGRGSIILIVGRFINLILSFVVVMIITRLLGPENFGIYSFAMSIAAILLTIPNLIDIGMVRYGTHYLILKEEGKAKDIFMKSHKLLIAMMLASILLTTAFTAQLSSFEYIFILMPYVFFSALSYLILTIFFYLRNPALSVIENILKNILLIVFAPLLIVLLGLSGSLIAYDLAAFGTFITMALLLYMLFWKRVAIEHAQENIKDIFKFTLPNFLSGFLNNMTQRTGVFILAYFAFYYGMKEVGYYNLALTIILSVGTLFFAIPEATMPAIFKFKTLEKKLHVQDAIDLSLKYSLIILIPVIFVLLYVAEPAVVFFFREDYARVGINIKIIAFFLLFLLIKKHFVAVLIVYNQVRYILYAEMISFSFFIIIAYILIPTFASLGAGVALVMGTGSSLVVIIWKTHAIGIKFPLSHFLKIFICNIPFLVLSFAGQKLLALIVVLGVLSLIYVLLLSLLGELNKSDYDKLCNLF